MAGQTQALLLNFLNLLNLLNFLNFLSSCWLIWAAGGASRSAWPTWWAARCCSSPLSFPCGDAPSARYARAPPTPPLPVPPWMGAIACSSG